MEGRTRVMILGAATAAAAVITLILVNTIPDNPLMIFSTFSDDCSFDWDVWRRATRDLFAGRNPYDTPEGCLYSFYNPVHTLLFLAPLTLLPRFVGYGLWIVINLVTLAFICRKFGQSKIDFILVALSAPSMISMFYGNIDFLPFVGLFFPLPVALIFFAIKPQNTVGLVLYLLYREYRTHGWVRVALSGIPVTILLALNVAIYGLPHTSGYHDYGSIFPFAVLPGLLLLYKAFKVEDAGKAAATSPFLTPYVGFNSFLGIMFGLRGLDLLIGVLFSYVLLIVTFLRGVRL